MSKLGNLPQETTFGSNDFFVKVKANNGGDVLVSEANLLTAIGLNNGVWQNWTPIITSLPSSVNFAKYAQIGKTIHYKFELGATGAATGNVSFSPPVNIGGSEDARLIVGHGFCEHASGAFYPLYGSYNSATSITLYAPTVSGSNIIASSINATTPFTWANGDTLGIQGTYESA